MSKKNILILFLFSLATAKADEGMWLPILLNETQIADMQSRGFKLTAEDIYSVNQSSMKDAVLIFGGGCTGEVVSGNGLVLTNHHCGFSSVNNLSTVEHNYLRDGYWAMEQKDELPCPGLSVTFIVGIYDLTDSITPYLNERMGDAERNEVAQQIGARIAPQYMTSGKWEASVKAFYYGTEFYLFITETFTDIRLVGVPPSSVGNFGGETDNWVWPRHTGDFSVFRIYADANNQPADYAADNKPFTPRYFFPISLKGVKENDFTMVYGFPGRTQEYLPSPAVDLVMHSFDPNRVGIRAERIRIMEQYMAGNDTVTLMYATKAKGLANAYKKWKGEMIGLNANDALAKKRAYEQSFTAWTLTPDGRPYAGLLDDIEKAYADYEPYSALNDYLSEAALGIEIIRFAGNLKELMALIDSDTASMVAIQAKADAVLDNAGNFYKNYSVAIDKDMFAAMMQMVMENVQANYIPALLSEKWKLYDKDAKAWAASVFSTSALVTESKLEAALQGLNKKKIKSLQNDPVWQLYNAIYPVYQDNYYSHLYPMQDNINNLLRRYMEGQRAFETERNFYPDANSTLRVAYGNVQGYTARDAVMYNYFISPTTASNKKIYSG
ncbi:MAG: S46 family peptidase [Chitinophagales bacterium]